MTRHFSAGEISQTHLYYTLDRGVTWDSLAKNGLPSPPSSYSVRDIYNFNNDMVSLYNDMGLTEVVFIGGIMDYKHGR